MWNGARGAATSSTGGNTGIASPPPFSPEGLPPDRDAADHLAHRLEGFPGEAAVFRAHIQFDDSARGARVYQDAGDLSHPGGGARSRSKVGEVERREPGEELDRLW